MPNGFPDKAQSATSTGDVVPSRCWHSFPEILQRLHKERIYIHPDQLAEFMVRHGLPVDIDYVPEHLQERAKIINANYQGDMAKLDEVKEPPSLFPFE